MKLSYEDKSQILKRLPNLKLPYENIHKKVLSELYYIIPKGKKHLVWFTYIKDKKVCIFIEINPGSKKMIKNLFVVPQTFNKKIVLGTVFYGTLIESKDKKLFSIESIHFYKGKNIEEQTTGKLQYFKRKRASIAYMESTVDFQFLFLLLPSSPFHCLCLVIL